MRTDPRPACADNERNVYASVFTSGGPARVVTGAMPSVIGGMTVILPGRWWIASGTRTVVLVAAVMLRPSGPKRINLPLRTCGAGEYGLSVEGGQE